MKINHIITGKELLPNQILSLFEDAYLYKNNPCYNHNVLKNKHLALFFDKPSLRTRMSFTIAMQSLGGSVIESNDHTRKKENPADQARVLNGYCQAVMIRTHAHDYLQQFKEYSKIPIINGLSDDHHPCQILADLFTLKNHFHNLADLTLTYIGDGNNILHSLLLLAPQLGIHLRYCCPSSRQPKSEVLIKSLERCAKGSIQSFSDPVAAVKNTNVVYTDVWTSMGFESQSNDYIFDGFQVNEQLMQHADLNSVLMHCLPMERGKEVSHTLPDSHYSIIFEQSENRLHFQKALLVFCMTGDEK
jgi:ornithine carbamoyltransferase